MKKSKSRIAAFMLCGVLGLSAAACAKKPESPNEAESLPREVGQYLALTAKDNAYTMVSSGKGMSGTGGRVHLHDNAAGTSYVGDKRDYVFDVGRMEQLGELHVWNLNEQGKTDCGLQEVQVSYSTDGEAYTALGIFTLAKAAGTGSSAATDLEGGGCIDFNGITARYIKLSPQSNYGGNAWGLSEVRAFRYKQQVKVGAYIAASPIQWLTNDGDWTASAQDYNMTNGSGMSDPFAFDATCDNDPDNMTLTGNETIGFKYDLGGNYPVSQITLWNYNDPAALNNGVQKFKLKVSDDGVQFKSLSNTTYTLPKGSGADGMAPSLTVTFDESVRSRYFMVEIISNYGGNKTGLSEVRFKTGNGWFTDEKADYSALLSNYSGWTGADGIYTVNLDGVDYDANRKDADKSTFFVFSDSIVSQVNAETGLRSGVYMPNNTSATLKGNKPNPAAMTFVYPASGKDAANIKPMPAEPSTDQPASKNKYYWLGDTFVLGNKLYVYALKIDTVAPTSGFSFEQCGVDLACYDIKDGAVDYDSLRIVKDTSKKLCNIDNKNYRYYFGGAVLEPANSGDENGYVYVYGYLDKQGFASENGRNLVVSRVKPENIENFGEYEYLGSNGSWSKSTADMKSLCANVAPEVSISKIQSGENKGKYLFVYTRYTSGNNVYAAIGDSPYSGFTNPTQIYYHDSTKTVPGVGNNSYNAKAHPALSNEQELIITYNVNGNDCFTYADIYRPRFIRLAKVPQ